MARQLLREYLDVGAARGRLGWEAPGMFEEQQRSRAAGGLGRKRWQEEARSRPGPREGSGFDRGIGSITSRF